MATISRAEMQAAIAAGGVVLHAGRVYTDPKDLPTEAELARGDPAREQRAKDDLRARIDALEAQLAGLTTHPAAPAAAAPKSPASPTSPPTHPTAATAGPPTAARPEPPKPEGKK